MKMIWFFDLNFRRGWTELFFMKRRVASRKEIAGLTASHITSLTHFAVIARRAVLVDASSTGFLLCIHREDLIPKNLRQNLTLDSLRGERIMIRINEMDLEIEGVITRTKMAGKGLFEVGVDFSHDAPAYWREAFMDLLPGPSGFDDDF